MTAYSQESLRALIQGANISQARAAELACVSTRMIEMALAGTRSLSPAAWKVLQTAVTTPHGWIESPCPKCGHTGKTLDPYEEPHIWCSASGCGAWTSAQTWAEAIKNWQSGVDVLAD